MADEPQNHAHLSQLSAELVSAYVANNNLRTGDLPELIRSVYASLNGLGAPQAPSEPEKPTPAVPVRKSITPDHILSLLDGKPYKSLTRHLNGRGLTPEQYRTMFGLPSNYPMTAPAYSAKRSELAKSLGLGRKPSAQAEPTVQAEPDPEAKATDSEWEDAAPKSQTKRSRKKKDIAA